MINEQDVIDFLIENNFSKIGSDGKDSMYKYDEHIHSAITIALPLLERGQKCLSIP